MSGELQVVFIYDTQRCRKEEDDPRDAIIYFHPDEIPECRRIAICGQLMGITQFLLDIFSAPKIISLENGKFALKDFGKHYILALGCSSVTPDWLLEKQADILYQITKFFHKDIDNILTAVGEDRSLLQTKLTSIMDHYIPISQHHGDLFALTFGILPILNLPKSANHISLSATVLLQTAKLSDGVLGGIVMFQNKVIAVELMQNLARKLAFIQPYQLPPADNAPTKFPLPPGVQLLRVYVKTEDLDELRNYSSTYQKYEPNSQLRKPRGRFDSIIEEEPSDVSSSQSQSVGYFGGDSQSQTTSSIEEKDVATAKKMSEPHIPTVLNPFRLFKSLENLRQHHQSEDDLTSELKKFSTSLTDPLFPYLRCDGKNISKFYLDAYAYPNPDFSANDEDEEVKEFMGIKSKFNSDALPVPIQQIVEKEVEIKKAFLISEKLSAAESEKENEPPQPVSKVIEFTPKTSGISRPKDLALNLNSTSKTKSKRRWSTFEDMMSPVFENAAPQPSLPQEEVSAIQMREKSASISVTDPLSFLNKISHPESASSYKSTLLSSFRKLSSQEPEDLSDSGKGSEKSSTTSKLELKSSEFPFPPWSTGAKRSNDKLFCSSDSELYEDVVLFIYSLGGMRLLLLLERNSQDNRELIQTLRDYGSTSIADLEIAVSNVEEQSMSMGPGHHDHYCYLHYEPVWRSLAHGGRNHSMDFDVVQHMHQDFHIYPNINELIIRGDDHVVYGYQCVGSEIFYQQSADPQPGLPMPSDLMGKVPLKAKRRLERNHNILLL